MSIGFRHRAFARVMAAFGLASALFIAEQAMASPVVGVTAIGCAEGVRMSSKQTPISALLTRMSDVLQFKLKIWATEDPLVDINMQGNPERLIAVLAQHANLIVRYSPDPKCPGQLRIDTVWVLQGGPPSKRTVVEPKPQQPPESSKVAPSVPAQPDPAMQEYLRAHGMAAPAQPASQAGSTGR